MTLRVVLLWLILAASVSLAQTGDRAGALDARLGGAVTRVLSATETSVSVEIGGVRLETAPADRQNLTYAERERAGLLVPLFFMVGLPHDAEGITVEFVPLHTDTIRLAAPLRADGVVGASAGGNAVQRGIRTVALRYQPARIEGGALILVRDGRATIRWRRGARSARAGAWYPESPAMENMLRGVIVNYDQASAWRARPARSVASASRTRSSAPAAASAGPSGWGMEEAVVLRVGGDGVYGVSGQELAATGAPVIGSPTANLRLRTGASDVAMFVDDANGNGVFEAEDRIEFAGRRNNGFAEGLYFNDVTDTNAYILSWRGGGARLEALSGPSSAPEVAAYDSTLHIEEEHFYFPGISYPDAEGGDVRTIHFSERVPNERFYWSRLSYPLQAVLSFDASPAMDPGGMYEMEVRIAGVTDTLHRVIVELNGNAVADVVVDRFSDTTFRFPVAAYHLVNGRNQLVLRPTALDGVDPATKRKPDVSYLDYITLRGRWLPSAWTDRPKMTMPAADQGARRVHIAGLRSPATSAITSSRRFASDSTERGYTFRLTSRQLPPSSRNAPGFVALIGDSVIGTPYFGLGLMLIEIDAGRVVRHSFFNLYDGDGPTLDAAYRAAEQFIASVPDGNIIAGGFSVGGGSRGELTQGLKDALSALGARQVGGNTFVASWVFAARKGDPASATERFARFETNDRGVTMDAFIADPRGTTYRSAFTLDCAGQEVQFGAPTGGSTAAQLHYHGADSLLDPANRADMIIVTHPAFAADAYRLARHRELHPPVPGAFTVRVVDVDRIYDEFNNGVKSPVAVRRFLQYADSNWTAPSAGYVLLFGDASWDPQRRLPGSTTVDYVPTNGIPSTDFIYSVPFGDDSAYTWQHSIGRLPATNTADARAMVDKLIEYDTLPPAQWNKRFVFLAGGGSRVEVDYHREQNQQIAETYVLGPQFLGDTAMVWRTSDNLALPDDKDADWARGEINKGTVWMNFSGHGAIDIADLDYGFPEQFNNGNRYFVLGTFSCQTGAFAEPTTSVRNERFVTYPGRGAIAAIGGTSYSFPLYDRAFKDVMFDGLTRPPYRRVIGDLFTSSKYVAYFEPFKFGGWDMTISGYIGRNSLFMYNLLADPSMKIGVSRVPELAMANVTTAGKGGGEPLPGDSTFAVRMRLWNHGMPLGIGDTVAVVASIADRGQVVGYDTVMVDTLRRYADVEFELPLGRNAGEYTVRLMIDPEARIPETYRRDNDTTFVLRVRGNQVLLIEPVSFGRVHGYDDVKIHLLNPASGPGAQIVVDTTPRFDSPARFTNADVGSMDLAELTTTWTFSIPGSLRGARRFWWRAVAASGDTATAGLFPLVESFTVETEANVDFVVGGVDQMARGSITNLVNDQTGIGPGERPMPIAIKVFGQSFFRTDIPNPEIDINNRINPNFASVFIDGRDYNRPAFDGINLVILRGGRVHGPRGSFSIDRPGDVDRFLLMADTVAPGDRVVLWSNGQTFVFFNRGDELRAALRRLGMSDSVLAAIRQEDSYALIGGPGLPREEITEKWEKAAPRRATGEKPPYYVTLDRTLNVPPGPGLLELPMVGPATAWRGLRMEGRGTSGIRVTVFGVRRDGLRDSLLDAPAPSVDISAIAKDYPRLVFRLAFDGDTATRLTSFGVYYDPSPELAFMPSTTRLERDSVLQGTPNALRASLVNLSLTRPAVNVGARVSYVRDARVTTLDSFFVAGIAPRDSVQHTFTIPTDKLKDVIALQASLNPADLPAEPYRQNNTLGLSMKVGLDDLRPSVSIYADGARLIDGDFVAPLPTFEVRIADNSDLDLDDSAAIRMILDDDIITLATPGATYRTGDGTNGYRGSFYYVPPEPLENGRHDIKVFTTDASGNGDTTDFIPFYVERELSIRNVVNWPNPTPGKTMFTFMATGASAPKSGEIALFTVAGRKIKTIRLNAAQLNIGFNRVEWDGLDEDGDRIANGVYLYRVRIENADGLQEAQEKLVIMR